MTFDSEHVRGTLLQLAGNRELGVRRLILVGKDMLVEVVGAAANESAHSPIGKGRKGQGMDHYMATEDTISALSRVVKDGDFAWLRCLNGVVIVMPVGDGRLLVADTTGDPVRAGVLMTYLDCLAKHLLDGRPLRLPKKGTN